MEWSEGGKLPDYASNCCLVDIWRVKLLTDLFLTDCRLMSIGVIDSSALESLKDGPSPAQPGRQHAAACLPLWHQSGACGPVRSTTMR